MYHHSTSSVHQYHKSGPYWAPDLPYYSINRTGGYFQKEGDNWEKRKHGLDFKARKETRGVGRGVFYFYLLFFKQYLNSALSLNCLRGPIPQYHCRSFTGITLKLKVCSTERKRSTIELSAIFLWYAIITQVGRRLAANCQQAL